MLLFFYKIKQNYILFQFKKDSICIFDPLYFVFLYFSVTIMCNSYFLWRYSAELKCVQTASIANNGVLLYLLHDAQAEEILGSLVKHVM